MEWIVAAPDQGRRIINDMGLTQAPSVAPPIDDIVRAIVDAVHPRRVVLFGSHVRGDTRPDSDVDLMVEIDGETDPRARATEIRALGRGRSWTLDPKVYATEWVARMRDDPGTLIYTIVREGKVLYTSPNAENAPLQVRERPAQPESLAWWLRAANDDLFVIETLCASERVPWLAVSYHAQQAAEKYLKALLIQRGTRPDRTHDLGALLAACRAAGYALPGIDADCAFLSSFVESARYPDDLIVPSPPPAWSECKAAAEACDRIIVAARPHLPP